MATSDSQRAEFRVHIVSWNVASSPLTPNDVRGLFEFSGTDSQPNDPLSSADIVVIGLQEAYQSVPEALSAVIGSDDTVELFSRYLVPKSYVIEAFVQQDAGRRGHHLHHDSSCSTSLRLEDRGFDEVVELVSKKEYERLLLCDQLRLEQLKGDRGTSGLDYFLEMPITFPPMYKYAPGTDEFSPVGKGPGQRAPAWCDRILWNVHERQYPKISDPNPQFVVKPEDYTIHMEPRVSDHKAVSGGLRILADVGGFSPKVVFLLQTWWVGEDALIVFDVAEGTVVSYWDRVALYQADFTSEKDCIHWSLTPVAKGTSAKSQCCCFNISGTDMPSQPGYYVLVYKSVEYGRVIGMSPVFPIVHRESVVSDDWEIVES